MMGSGWAEYIAFSALALALYAILVWLANLYSRRVNWQPPVGSEETDWNKRRNLGLALGGLAMLACALSSMVWLGEWRARLLAVAQAALLAAAGTSDLRRFHLPLPFTLTGIGAGLVVILATGVRWQILLFALFWAGLSIVMHAIVSRRSMQLGDYIATIWIAMLLPFNGLLAMLAGDLVNVALVRVKGLNGRKVAAAGAWLIFAAALISLPPYMTWITAGSSVKTTPHLDGNPHAIGAIEAGPGTVIAESQPMTGATTEIRPSATLSGAQVVTRTALVLIALSRYAGERTASVAFVDGRAGRIAAAKKESVMVAQYAQLAQRISPGSDVASSLGELATALAAYDMAAVRSASLELLQERERLAGVIAKPVQEDEP